MDVNRLRQISDENIDLMIKKNQDYSGQSGDNITATGLNGIAVRLTDKVERLRNLTAGDGVVNFESVRDTLNDISNYGLIGRLVEEGNWKSLPKMVYLAGPVDDISEIEALEWRAYVARELRQYGITCYSPQLPFTVGNPDIAAPLVSDLCRIAILHSDLVLANLSGPGRAFGTIREIEFAVTRGVPTMVVGDIKSLFAHDVTVVKDLNTAISKITGGK